METIKRKVIPMGEKTIFEIVFNEGAGRLAIWLEPFFARKENGRFINTIKPDIYQVFQLVHDWCKQEQVEFLMNFLAGYGCQDLVNYYKKKYGKKGFASHR